MSPRALAACALGLCLLAGCGGSEERRFTPQSFVEEINAEGAAVALGDVLTRNERGVEIHAVTFTEAATAATGEGRVGPEEHGSGTLLVLEDAAAAEEEYDRCQPAPSLTCFRAANAVLRFEDLEPADQARVVSALETIATVEE